MNCGVSPSTFKRVSDSATLRQRTTPIAGITDQAPLVAATTASKREFQPGIRRRPKDRRSRAREALPIAAAATRSLSSKRARGGLGGGAITVTHRTASAEPPMPNVVPNWKWIDHGQRQRHPQIEDDYATDSTISKSVFSELRNGIASGSGMAAGRPKNGSESGGYWLRFIW